MTLAPDTSAGPSKTPLLLSFLAAAVSDGVSSGTALMPPVQWAVDGTTPLESTMSLGSEEALSCAL